jgi:hypothetical protein
MRKRVSTAVVLASMAAMLISQVAMAMHVQVRAILH